MHLPRTMPTHRHLQLDSASESSPARVGSISIPASFHSHQLMCSCQQVSRLHALHAPIRNLHAGSCQASLKRRKAAAVATHFGFSWFYSSADHGGEYEGG